MFTGRHPVRSGLKEVKVALIGEGLPEEEVTIAEVLSKAGYKTSHVGKWHQGDIDESFPHNQGFDYAAFPVHQQAQVSLMTKEGAQSNNLLGWHNKTQSGEFAIDNRVKPYGLVTGLEAKKGGKAREVDLKPGEEWTQAHYIKMNERYQRQTLEQLQSLSKQDKPFFLQYWPLWPLNFVHDGEQNLSANGADCVKTPNRQKFRGAHTIRKRRSFNMRAPVKPILEAVTSFESFHTPGRIPCGEAAAD